MNALADFADTTIDEIKRSDYFIITSEVIPDEWFESFCEVYNPGIDIIEMRYAFGNLPLAGGRYLYHFENFENAETILCGLNGIVVDHASYLEQLDFRDPIAAKVMQRATHTVAALLVIGIAGIFVSMTGNIIVHTLHSFLRGFA